MIELLKPTYQIFYIFGYPFIFIAMNAVVAVKFYDLTVY